ncbi:MAG: S-methyl-5-thioribose-1-phosphate isomerase [Candidatus Eremiobacteraeota bacterium]|nr:S-methyl-5-thioribose-1-phosphate isomerase [Candidatus Eremiobacteraeota bacterium]
MKEALRWTGDAIEYLDQRRLPHETVVVRARTVDELESAIKTLAIRGAPAIGVFGAYAVALLRRDISDDEAFGAAVERIRTARPTAVNLRWAVDRVLSANEMLAEASAIHEEQHAIDRLIAQAALPIFDHGSRVLTHCNTGSIATAGGGTALGAIIAAAKVNKNLQVYACETRPLLQGARLTMYELRHAGVDATLIVDSAAAVTMQQKKIDLVIVGADRIAKNGDTANKIGTYGLAIAAAHHGIPFYVAAPRSSFDLTVANGSAIPIEERSGEEVLAIGGVSNADARTVAYNPAFDVTPGRLVTAFITEYGLLQPPYSDSIPELAYRPSVAAFA